MTELEKKCSRCGEVKSRNDFWKAQHRSGKRIRKDGIEIVKGECKKCSKKLHNEWRRKNPTKQKQSDLRKYYGITLKYYEELLKKQNYSCALCGSKKAGGKGSFHVDHNHVDGKIRGLLCHYCNVGLGCFKDNIETMEKAIIYVRAIYDRSNS